MGRAKEAEQRGTDTGHLRLDEGVRVDRLRGRRGRRRTRMRHGWLGRRKCTCRAMADESQRTRPTEGRRYRGPRRHRHRRRRRCRRQDRARWFFPRMQTTRQTVTTGSAPVQATSPCSASDSCSRSTPSSSSGPSAPGACSQTARGTSPASVPVCRSVPTQRNHTGHALMRIASQSASIVPFTASSNSGSASSDTVPSSTASTRIRPSCDVLVVVYPSSM